MYNIGPLDAVRRLFDRLVRESNYWMNRLGRVVPGGRARRPQTPDLDNFKGSPILLIAVGGCLFLCLCLVAVFAIVGVLVFMNQGGM